MLRRGTLALAGAAAMLALACGGDDAAEPAPAGEVASPTAGTTARAAASESPAAAPAPTHSPVAKTTPATAADLALAAAAAKYKAIIRPSTEPCTRDNEKKQPCISLQSPASAAERGTVAIGVADAAGFGGFVAIFGRDSAGAWDLWFGTQNQSYHAWILPADMLVCADGDGLNVRKAPGSDAPIVTLLKDLVKVRAEEFVLIAAASGQKQGTGWYRLSSPVEGWAHSSFLSDARLNDCSLRDLQKEP